MNRRGQPLSSREQPLREGAPRAIVAQRDDRRVVGNVLQRRDRREHVEAEHGGSDDAGGIVDESDRYGIRARLVRALQNVGDDRTLSPGTDHDDALHTCAIVAQ